MTTHVVLVWPACINGTTATRGKFNWRCGEFESPKPSGEPLLSAARFLLDGGYAQFSDRIELQHSGHFHTSLRATVGIAASLTVSESDSGKSPPRFVPYAVLPKARLVGPVKTNETEPAAG